MRSTPRRKNFQWKFFPSSWWRSHPLHDEHDAATSGGPEVHGFSNPSSPDAGPRPWPSVVRRRGLGGCLCRRLSHALPDHARETVHGDSRAQHGIVPRPAASRVGAVHRVRRWPSSATLSFGSIWFCRGTRYNMTVWRCRKPLRRVTWNVRFATLPFCHFVKTARRARDVVIRVGRVG